MKKIILPIAITVGVKKKKNIGVGLNRYRNAHYIQSNNIKKIYKLLIEEQIPKGLKIDFALGLRFTYYNPTKRKSDLENRCVIINKFFQDALVDLGVIEDDNYDYIKVIEYKYGGYDKNNGRVEIDILEYKG